MYSYCVEGHKVGGLLELLGKEYECEFHSNLIVDITNRHGVYKKVLQAIPKPHLDHSHVRDEALLHAQEELQKLEEDKYFTLLQKYVPAVADFARKRWLTGCLPKSRYSATSLRT